MPSKQLQISGDGSSTIYSPIYGECYHSRYGAVQESMHVFIKMGLQALPQQASLSIFEMGLGTGLNALLSWQYRAGQSLHYTAIEAEPLEASLAAQLNYADEGTEARRVLQQIHAAEWGRGQALAPGFTFCKHQIQLQEYETDEKYDLVYYDAFAPTAQPELWTEAIFARLYGWMNPGSILVTYCAKGAVRRAMQAVGFEVERLPGPPGKREMLRASIRR